MMSLDRFAHRFGVWYTGQPLEKLKQVDAVNLFITRSRWRSYFLTVFRYKT